MPKNGPWLTKREDASAKWSNRLLPLVDCADVFVIVRTPYPGTDVGCCHGVVSGRDG